MRKGTTVGKQPTGLTRVLVAPLYLSPTVTRIAFDRRVELQLDCHICRRTERTVVLDETEAESYCRKTRHPYPGRVTGISVREEQRSGRSLVEATYAVEYQFRKFRDAKYRWLKTSKPYRYWRRVGFTLTCACGREQHVSIQPNEERPWTTTCDCGTPLLFQVDEIPLISGEREALPPPTEGFTRELAITQWPRATRSGDPPPLAVILVHGTWGRGMFPSDTPARAGPARWFEAGSNFRLSLEPLLAERFGEVDVSEFHWSGANSFFSREQASVELAGKLEEHHTRAPFAKYLIIAHSHGGNVAFRAIQRLAELGTRIDDLNVVTMGTPFLRIRDNPRLTDYSSASRFLVASLIAASLVYLYPIQSWWVVFLAWLAHASVLGLLLGLIDSFIEGLHTAEPWTQARLQQLRRATYFPAAAETNTLVLRCSNDEAALAIAAGAITERTSRLLHAADSWLVRRTGPRGRWLLLLSLGIGLGLAVVKSPKLSGLLDFDPRPCWFAALFSLLGVYVLGLLASLLSGVGKSTFGRELLLASGVLEASAESTPDSRLNTIVRTLPTVEIRGGISTAMDYRWEGKALGRGGLTHSVYDEPECPVAIAEWLAQSRN